MDKFKLFEDVRKSVPGYARFLEEQSFQKAEKWEDIPICDKQNYLLKQPITDLIREGSFKKCSLIGASSGFSKSGTVFWLKQSEDEAAYLQQIRELLNHDYRIKEKSTLIIVSLALGTWIGGMQLASTMRSLAGEIDGVVTATPGIDLKESVQIAKQFGPLFDQILWITNVSSINIIYSLLKDDAYLMKARINFAVVGEYFTEAFRETMTQKLGFPADFEWAIKTGYGSADAGDLGIESKDTIRLRKYLLHHPDVCRKVFGEENPPMLFNRNEQAFMETIDGKLVVTKDQFVPLVRYDTHDNGGLVHLDKLKEAGVPGSITKELPEYVLYIYGRTTDSIIFYGTNLNVYESGDFLNSLDESYAYGGLFEVGQSTENDIDFIDFTVYVNEIKEGLDKKYQEALIGWLKASSNEFTAKYDKLKAAVNTDLIRISLRLISEIDKAKKHHIIKN